MRLRQFLGGWAGLAPSKPALMHKLTYRRLTDQQLRALEAKGRRCQPARATLEARTIPANDTPACCANGRKRVRTVGPARTKSGAKRVYGTQVAAIADI
jgi:hypothetical protein